MHHDLRAAGRDESAVPLLDRGLRELQEGSLHRGERPLSRKQAGDLPEPLVSSFMQLRLRPETAQELAQRLGALSEWLLAEGHSAQGQPYLMGLLCTPGRLEL